ncbi:hypothetical protein LguiA_023022 [Lonicera macranthoides]
MDKTSSDCVWQLIGRRRTMAKELAREIFNSPFSERSSGRRWTIAKELAREIFGEGGELWPERLPEKEDSDNQRSCW